MHARAIYRSATLAKLIPTDEIMVRISTDQLLEAVENLRYSLWPNC